jgi:hypothetical protein
MIDDAELASKLEAVRQAGRQALERPPQKKPKLKTRLIEEARGDIAVMRTKGWSWVNIAEAYQEAIGATPETIRYVIGEKLKKSNPRARKKSKQEKPMPQVSPARREHAVDTASVNVPKKPFGPKEA